MSNRAFVSSIAYCIAYCRHILYLDFRPFPLEEKFSPQNPLFSDSVL